MVMAVVRGLVADIGYYLIEMRRADGERSVADLPREFYNVQRLLLAFIVLT